LFTFSFFGPPGSIVLFCLFIAHTCDITDDVERCVEVAGEGQNVEWIVSQKEKEKCLIAMETESLGMRMFGIGRAIQTFDGPDSDMELKP